MDEVSIKLERPLFFRSPFGLRFEIGPSNIEVWNNDNKTLNSEYFREALERANNIFSAIFEPNDDISIVYQIFSDGRRKIKKRNAIFKYVDLSINAIVDFSDHREIYSEDFDYKCECWKRSTISGIRTKDINANELLKAAINTDFRSLQPSFNGDCYFINHRKQLILNLYDDRGMDVVSTTKQALVGLYRSHYDLILAHDKEQIDSLFS
jgi:hypothetical protein